ncbi:ATPase [Candidatus Geothermarchaeota archaeon ex4572_27]|nr:MAG: ATPase [Candidatus Geothermarchaeota archaeon ex4572_27]
MTTYIPTPEVLRKGLVSELVESGEVRGSIVIPWSVVTSLERDTDPERGLRELERLRVLSDRGLVELRFVEDSQQNGPTLYQLINLALQHGATLILDNPTHARLAKALGAGVHLVKRRVDVLPRITRFFDGETMSVHLKEGVEPRAKKGRPGSWRYVPISDRKMTREELEEIIDEILDFAAADDASFIETDREYMKIVQLRDFRIVIAKPPFSDGYEVTVVRPIRKLSLEDYNLPEELIERLERRAEGILIAGAPGEGKSTFAQALAEFYMSKGKVVKTIESPRDLQLPADITQYSKVAGDSGCLHDILLLSRPDYTIFDEMRTTEDFELFVDLRLAGVGMIGVVHATSPIDAIQRFVERIDLGMIPSVLDTVIFLRGGKVSKVYEVAMVAKVPYGLERDELARPVVEVRDFFTKRVEYELYVFGKRVFVIPVNREGLLEEEYESEEERASSLEDAIRRELGEITDEIDVKVISDREAVIFVPPWGYRQLKKALRRKARKIRKKFGVRVTIEPAIGFEE